MESQRSFLFIGLALVSYLLWQQWQMDYGPKPVQTTETSSPLTQPVADGSADVPLSLSSQATPEITKNAARQLITVHTDTLLVTIDTKGGDLVSAELLKFPVTQDSEQSYSLLRPDGEHIYIAQSGLIGANGPDASAQGRPTYNTEALDYVMSGDSLTVPLTYTSSEGLTVQKNFVFYKGQHKVELNYQIQNNSASTASLQQYAQLKQSMNKDGGSMFMPTYRGAAYSTKEVKYEKYPFDDIADEKLRETTIGGWVGMLEHYFVSAWIPPQDETNNLFSRVIADQFAVIGYTGEPVNLAAGQSTIISSTLYMGPKDQDDLANIARGLDLTVDYGFLWWISKYLFSLLQWIHSLVGNWGLAIIVTTIIVKGAMYPLTKKQYESMAKMRTLKPKMDALKERFGDDRQKMSQAMMELYKKDKVNPMGGCFPLLLQMPIFLALYWVLLESVELRQADFFLWITDLSVKDPFFVLPVLTGISMYLLQKLQPMTMTDPMQQKIMQFMPVAMSLFFFIFPAGLVLYWLISNIITLIQAKIIYSSMEKRGIATK
jgi:YidC/Oxa1 family membrane protein insertase